MKISKVLVIVLVLVTPLLGCSQLMTVANTALTQAAAPTNDEIVSALKQALTIGIQNGANRVGVPNGYLGNSLIKIPMPPEAQKVENTLREMGLGSTVDNAIANMNHAAENAAVQSIPIFTSAITNMSITDAVGILKGGNTAATDYLKRTTGAILAASFRPTIQNALDKVNATKYWGEVFNTYNKIPTVTPVNPDLTGYVTQKAIDGLFVEVAQEEAKIRTNPTAQVTDLLKKVFGQPQ